MADWVTPDDAAEELVVSDVGNYSVIQALLYCLLPSRLGTATRTQDDNSSSDTKCAWRYRPMRT
jgi:hypothetical protein